MARFLEWVTSNGTQVRLEATYQETMETEILRADGQEIEGNLKPIIKGNMVVFANGKEFDSCQDPNFWGLIDTNKGKKIWGLRVGLTDENAERYEAFLAEVIESGKSEEVRQCQAKIKAEQLTKEKEYAQKIIDAAAKATIKNADGSLMTSKQAAAWQRNYNNLHNEGGEGYIPLVITREQLDRALAIVNQ